MQDMPTDTFAAPLPHQNARIAETPSQASLFEGHALKAVHGLKPVPRTAPTYIGVLMVIIACCAILIYLKRSSQGIFTSIFGAVMDRQRSMQDSRIENAQHRRNLFLSVTVALMSIALFIAGYLSVFFHYEPFSMEIFARCGGVVLLIFLAKKAAVRVLSLMFDLEGTVRTAEYDSTVYLSALGLLLLPLSLLVFFSPNLPVGIPVFIGTALIALLYFRLLFRTALSALRSRAISPLHLFYYLCALEILPVFVVIRFVQKL